jgi:PqqD family protein of HPr-rel-A system
MTMKIKNNIAVSDNGFVFNPGSGESFTVNPVGLEMLNQLRKGLSQTEIIAEIQAAYNTEEAIIERDLLDFLDMLRQYRLIQLDDE